MEILSRNWGWVALRGVIAILFGVLAVLRPGITLAALVLMYGAYALVDGVFTIVSAVANRRGEPRWVALVFAGILGVAAGLVTFFWPGITAVALLVVIAAWAITTGIATIVAAIQLRKQITGEWMLVIDGLLSVTLGVILIASPAAGALAMALWIGAYAMVAGALLIGLGFRLRSWGLGHRAHALSHP